MSGHQQLPTYPEEKRSIKLDLSPLPYVAVDLNCPACGRRLWVEVDERGQTFYHGTIDWSSGEKVYNPTPVPSFHCVNDGKFYKFKSAGEVIRL